MRYFVGGDGPPLVLVHGLGGAASNWTELAPLLAGRHRLLVPDLPGHGGSSALPAVSGLEPFADRVALVAEGDGSCSPCSHRFGPVGSLPAIAVGCRGRACCAASSSASSRSPTRSG